MKGIFVTASVATRKLSEILNSVSVPVVIIGNSIPGVACDRVSTANEEGAYKATMHLIRSGHENIAICAAVKTGNLIVSGLKGINGHCGIIRF